MAQFGKRNTGSDFHSVRQSAVGHATVSKTAAIDEHQHHKAPEASKKTSARDSFFLVLLAAAGLWYMTSTYSMELVRDHRKSGTWQVAYDLRVVDASCRRVQLVVTFCTAKITSLAEPQKAPVESEFMMMFSSGGGEKMIPVRSTTDPSAVAVAYSAETKLMNRTISWLVSVAILLTFLLGGLAGLTRKREPGRPAYRDQQTTADATQLRPIGRA